MITFNVLTECFALLSSSSCSKELASSLNSPTSSQFFRKRVGVGVWSSKRKNKEIKQNRAEIIQMSSHFVLTVEAEVINVYGSFFFFLETVGTEVLSKA